MMTESNYFLHEAEYTLLRNRVQSILKTGTQAWGEASTFAEMNAGSLNAILDAFFPAPTPEAVVLDIGSGLGNFPFRASLFKNARSIGIEFNRDLHLQTVQLLQELIQSPLLNGDGELSSRMQCIYGDANQITSLEGVTHLYMFNKNMPQSIFMNLADVANECSTLQVVLSHYDLRKLGWTDLELVGTFASKLTGSGEASKTLMYRVAPRRTKRLEPTGGIKMSSYIKRMDQFRSLPLSKILAYWDEDAAKVDVSGTKFVVDESSGSPVRRTQRQPGRGAALEDFVRRSLPSDLVKFEDLQADWRGKKEFQSPSKKDCPRSPSRASKSPPRASKSPFRASKSPSRASESPSRSPPRSPQSPSKRRREFSKEGLVPRSLFSSPSKSRRLLA